MPATPPSEPVILRAETIGDIGWIVHRHGVLYAAEYGWDITFEALVAEIAGAFVRQRKPGREACLIADRGGRILGSAFVVEADVDTAKLRLVYLEPEARGHGIGRQLVEGAMDFARAAGYARMQLWTQDVLVPARGLYTRLGFAMIASEPHRSFGADLVGETWARDL